MIIDARELFTKLTRQTSERRLNYRRAGGEHLPIQEKTDKRGPIYRALKQLAKVSRGFTP